ncbi:MAG TPA: tetratricopeptide repeat protein [Stackebrandtia sp.]|jgi:tetratricopeptide (TPR) repeat protein|uniref:tetratricopeptide repeat protein n=1 Tax=Stackebrandtia sp. TaxID=2023065 RepID=UPI002D6CBEAB|nr:tetratricopeptide repeat protein [Stackebrandtia sp.]HZE40218.1 tetratricopeptide repeat protein [Stackebrandtia sp.]
MEDEQFDRLQNRLRAYGETDRPVEGERLVREALLSHPDDTDLLGWLAIMLGMQDRWTEGLDVLDDALAMAPDDDRLHWIRSTLLFETGDCAGAVATIDRAVELDPEDVGNLQKQAALLAAEHRFDEAEAVARRALERDPANAELLAVVGVCARQRGDIDAAVEALAESLRHDPGQADVWKLLGLMQLLRGRARPSIEALRNAVGVDPSMNLASYLAWPITNTAWRPRWLLPLAAALTLLGGLDGGWGTACRVAAGAVIAGALADAARWPFLGGSTSWRALRVSSRWQWLSFVGGSALLLGISALLAIALFTGATAAAWWAVPAVAALWAIGTLEMSMGPDEDYDLPLATRLRENLAYWIGADIAIARRAVKIASRKRPSM